MMQFFGLRAMPWFWLAVLVLAALAALLVWNGLNARLAAAPAAEQR